MALNLCLLFSTWNATPNHERHDSTRKNKATMYSCYSFANNQYKRSMDLHNERNHGISACPSLRKITADLSWSFLYGGAMRYLKGGRLFEYVRLECVFYADFESVLGCFPHETQLPTMRNMLRGKKASMYSCYSLQSSNTSVEWNCTMNAIVWCLLSHPCATALQTR